MTKFAQFKDLKWSYVSPLILAEEDSKHTKLVRVSDWADVEFVPRKLDEMVPEQVAALDNDIAEVTEKFGKALAELKTRKAELLSLTQDAVTA
jgi:hypothetical protein